MTRSIRQALIVHDMEQALVAARIAFDEGVGGGGGGLQALRLFSPPGGALYLGPGYWRALCEAVEEAHPDRGIECVLDCADVAGAALAAMGEGLAWIRFAGRADVAAKLSDIAAKRGARLIDDPLPDLDLGRVDDPGTACRLAFGRI